MNTSGRSRRVKKQIGECRDLRAWASSGPTAVVAGGEAGQPVARSRASWGAHVVFRVPGALVVGFLKMLWRIIGLGWRRIALHAHQHSSMAS